eukprot:364512-Chlamydomonas_euryale.AAC.3
MHAVAHAYRRRHTPRGSAPCNFDPDSDAQKHTNFESASAAGDSCADSDSLHTAWTPTALPCYTGM